MHGYEYSERLGHSMRISVRIRQWNDTQQEIDRHVDTEIMLTHLFNFSRVTLGRVRLMIESEVGNYAE